MIKIPIILKCKLSKSCIQPPIPSTNQVYTKFLQYLSFLMTFLLVILKIVILLPLIYHKKYFKWECVCEDQAKYLTTL